MDLLFLSLFRACHVKQGCFDSLTIDTHCCLLSVCLCISLTGSASFQYAGAPLNKLREGWKKVLSVSCQPAAATTTHLSDDRTNIVILQGEALGADCQHGP